MAIAQRSVRGLRRPRLGTSSQAREEAKWGYLLIGPMMIGFTIFFLLALLASLAISFTSWDIISAPEWVGLRNYTNLLRDEEFRQSLFYTAAITIPNVILRLACSLGLAIALNTDIRFRALYRVMFFMPVLTMPVAIGTIWKWLYDPAFGPINAVFDAVGLARVEWLSNPETAVIAVVIVLLWSGVGYDMIIYLAGLQTIPRDYYDAASLDGASSWQKFRDITLPLLTPTTFFLSVIAIIGSLQVFDLVFVMTTISEGNNRLPTVVYYVYEEGFANFRMGYAITVAWALLAIILLFTLLQFRLQRRWVHYA